MEDEFEFVGGDVYGVLLVLFGVNVVCESDEDEDVLLFDVLECLGSEMMMLSVLDGEDEDLLLVDV